MVVVLSSSSVVVLTVETVVSALSSSSVADTAVVVVTFLDGARLQSIRPSSPYLLCSQSFAFLKCPQVNYVDVSTKKEEEEEDDIQSPCEH